MKNIIFVLFVVSLISLSCSEAENSSPNIIFIIADDVSWNDFGCYGNKDVHTPNIDRLASEGLTFNNFYLSASSCSPSRTSIISGRYPHNTGSAELHTPLPAHLTVFPEELKKSGYHTGASGKWHMGDAAKRAFDTLTITDIGPGGEKHWINMLKDRPVDKPFFFWLAAIDAHRDWSADTCPNPHDPEILSVPVGLADMPRTKQDLASYYNEIQRFDSYVGLVREELEQQGVANNTLIIVMADNGRPFPRAKTRVYDSGMKTPFISWWPEGIMQKGTNVEALVSAIDLAPTFTALAGIDRDRYYQGKSFAKLFKEPGSEFREYVYAEHNWHDYEAYERMLRTKDYMYVYNGRPQYSNQGPGDAVTSPSMDDLRILWNRNQLDAAQADVFLEPRLTEELFNYAEDKEQIKNLATDSEYLQILDELRGLMKKWQEETADTEPQNLTKDGYVRGSYEKTEFYRIRGEMPGMSLRADTVKKSGPF